jgi:hypothetical protein
VGCVLQQLQSSLASFLTPHRSVQLDDLRRLVLHNPAILRLEDAEGGGEGGGGTGGTLSQFYVRPALSCTLPLSSAPHPTPPRPSSLLLTLLLLQVRVPDHDRFLLCVPPGPCRRSPQRAHHSAPRRRAWHGRAAGPQ